MSFFHSKAITAKLVGHNLVASFATANPPLLWKFDLERNHSFTIALQGDAGDWELGITSPKGEFYPVAHFPVREDAEEAMHKVQKVLLKKRRSLFWGIVRWILGIVLLIVLLFLGWNFMKIRAASSLADMNPSAAGMMGSMPSTMTGAMPALLPLPVPTITPGVPMSADDVVQPPK